MNFLWSVYASNKNWEFIGEDKDDDDVSNPDSEGLIDIEKNYKTFTYDWLFKQIK